MNKDLNNLQFHIPDYINGKIEDKEILSALENEININPEFKKVYEDFRRTLNFIDSTKVSEPPEYYFNTILPRINNRIDAKSKSGFSLITYLRTKHSYWKYLIPVLPVVIIILIYIISFNKITNVADTSGLISTDTNENGVVMNNNINENNPRNESDNIVQNDKVHSNPEINFVDTLKSTKIKNYEKNKVYLNEENSVENSEEIDLFSKGDDELNNLENEFLELNEGTQTEILNNLKNEKL